MPCEDSTFRIDQHQVSKTERLYTVSDLPDLLLRVRSRVLPPRTQSTKGDDLDGKAVQIVTLSLSPLHKSGIPGVISV
jgi:hypothetical protein